MSRKTRPLRCPVNVRHPRQTLCVADPLIGYARVSTEEQDLTAQRAALVVLGVAPERVYVDLLALVFFSGRDQRYNARRERKQEAKAKKPPSKAMQLLQRGTPRTTFVVGAVIIGIPGVSYLTAMDLLARQHESTFAAVLVVLAWNVIQLLILEVPIVAHAFAPDGTAKAVEGFKNWLTRDESRIAYWCALIAGAALLAIGVVHLVR